MDRAGVHRLRRVIEQTFRAQKRRMDPACVAVGAVAHRQALRELLSGTRRRPRRERLRLRRRGCKLAVPRWHHFQGQLLQRALRRRKAGRHTLDAFTRYEGGFSEFLHRRRQDMAAADNFLSARQQQGRVPPAPVRQPPAHPPWPGHDERHQRSQRTHRLPLRQ